MSKIMELFYGDLGAFQNDMEEEQWEVDFRGEKYPPRIVMEQLAPPLFEETEGSRPASRSSGGRICR